MAKITKIIFPILLIGLFLFLRFNNIEKGLFFWNDMGRDLSVLQTWKDTFKPPLLGPQTSALPINQSSIYFYFLYPLFLLFNGHPLSSLITCALLYVTTFLLGLSYIRRYSLPLKTSSIFIVFLLASIHPQYIIQNRFVWNPSLVSPFILVALYSFYLLQIKYSVKKLAIFSLSIATAVSISYSIAPLLIAIILYWLFFYRRHFRNFAITLILSFFLLNITTIFFEIRHNFLLTSSLFTKKSPTQESLTFSDKTNQLANFIFITDNSLLNIALFVSSLIICLAILYKYQHSSSALPFFVSFLYLTLTLISYLTPITIQPHYIFAYTCLLFILISSLNPLLKYPILIFAFIAYLNINKLNFYFRPAPRTYAQMENCFQQYCSQFNLPTYVSVQSDLHPFHNGPEHRYLLKKSGCNVKNIETENGQADYMTVILDTGSFSQQTKYYELDLFGKFTQDSTFNCLPNFQIILLSHKL